MYNFSDKLCKDKAAFGTKMVEIAMALRTNVKITIFNVAIRQHHPKLFQRLLARRAWLSGVHAVPSTPRLGVRARAWTRRIPHILHILA